ncbi:MAG: hypothetical protein ABII12_12065 [Planctomycetota bacterium]
MTQTKHSCAMMPRFLAHVRKTLLQHPRAGGELAVSQCPAVVDVMGGIGEDTGSLVLTATLSESFIAAAWQTQDRILHVRFADEANKGPLLDFGLPIAEIRNAEKTAKGLLDRCREAGGDWAATTCRTLAQAVRESMIPSSNSGLMILLQSGFSPQADLGRPAVQAAATIDVLCKLFGSSADRLQQSRLCAGVVEHCTGLYGVRTPMAALCGSPDGSLLQLRFYPQPICQSLQLPENVAIMAARTRLARPTTHGRMINTRTCTEMGRRIILALQQRDGMNVDAARSRLSSITPPEYVERYRDRMPSKITGKNFVAQFGEPRGLNGEIDPKTVYKVRSRAEHHIYENRRVHEFVTHLAMARRSGSADSLVQAGELMYASHWSHSQRCGIGGVEPDQLVGFIRKAGPAAGLFGAKVTAGGDGGEIVILMRDDERARAALVSAVAEAEALADHKIHTWDGSIGGADFFEPPRLADPAEKAGIA